MRSGSSTLIMVAVAARHSVKPNLPPICHQERMLQMGHASLRMTLDVYAKWIDKADRGRERDKASAAFGRLRPATIAGAKIRGR
jgi:hypothetical protein